MDRERGTSITERERAALDPNRPSLERLWAEAKASVDGSGITADIEVKARMVDLMVQYGYLSRES